MKVIGITGGVGSGKTQVLEYLNDKYGATICLTDEVARKLQRKGGEVFDAIVDHFGEEILDDKGELDRQKLGSIVFSDSEELAVLNSLVPISKAEVCDILPDVSASTVEAVLSVMVKNGPIKKTGQGRMTRYVKA